MVISVALMDLGFVTHGVHMNSRLVYLTTELSTNRKTATVTAPPRAGAYPPGPAWLFLVINDIPSAGRKVMVGTQEPPVDYKAISKFVQNHLLFV